MHLSAEGPSCDRCFDDRIAAGTGLPRLPDVPPPVAITDADGSSHTMIYRLSRIETTFSEITGHKVSKASIACASTSTTSSARKAVYRIRP